MCQVSSLCNVCANNLMETRKNRHTTRFLNGLKPLGLCYRYQEWAAKCLTHTKVWTLSVTTSDWKIFISWNLNLTSSEQRCQVKSLQVALDYTPAVYTWWSAMNSKESAKHPLNSREERKNLTWLKRNLGKKGGEALPCTLVGQHLYKPVILLLWSQKRQDYAKTDGEKQSHR